MRSYFIAAVAAVAAFMVLGGASGCESDADVASKNLSKAAEQFEVPRRIVGINGITDKFLFQIEGYCSVETSDSGLGGALEVTCKVAGQGYKKVFMGLSDNVSFVVEQLEPTQVSTKHYRVIFKPETLLPNITRP